MALSPVVALAASFLFAYVVTYIIYQVFLHPLAKYPGPFLAKLTDAYGGYYALRGKLHLRTYHDHKIYGPIIRHGPNKLVFNSAQAWRDIYNNDAVTKDMSYGAFVQKPGQFNVFTATEKHTHRPRRRLIGSVVSEQSMRKFEPTMSMEVEQFLRNLHHSSEAPINITAASRHLGLDIVGHLGFGHALRLQTSTKNRFLTRAFDVNNIRINTMMQWTALIPALRAAANLVTGGLRGRLLDLVEKMIRERMGKGKSEVHDLYGVAADKLVGGGEKGMYDGGMRDGDLWPEALFFFPAGGETTGTGLTSTFHHLSTNPHALDRLRHEIRSTFTSGDSIGSGPLLSSCTYLRACIDEALRLCPPVPATLWRAQRPESIQQGQQLIVDETPIPPGTTIGVNVYSLMRNEEYFENPGDFVPERWLEDDVDAKGEEEEEDDQQKKKREDMKSAFVAFSSGSRGCAGKAMAYLEASLVIARTVWYFDFEPAAAAATVGLGVRGKKKEKGEGGEEGGFNYRDTFAASHDGPWVRFKAREGVVAELEAKGSGIHGDDDDNDDMRSGMGAEVV